MKFKLFGTPWSPARRAREVTDEPRRTDSAKWGPAEWQLHRRRLELFECNRLWACPPGNRSGHRNMRLALWQRGMATAEVSPQNSRTASLTPSLLGYVGRYLLLRGEVLFEVGVRDGQITLTTAQSWTVQGGVDPE